MTDFFYSLPIWLATILVLAVALAIGLGVSIGIQRLFRIKSSAEEKEVAVNLMQVVAAYVGIMIAFAGVQVWQDFSDAKAAVAQEAAAASQLYQDLTIFGAETRPARSRRPSVASRLSIKPKRQRRSRSPYSRRYANLSA